MENIFYVKDKVIKRSPCAPLPSVHSIMGSLPKNIRGEVWLPGDANGVHKDDWKVRETEHWSRRMAEFGGVNNVKNGSRGRVA